MYWNDGQSISHSDDSEHQYSAEIVIEMHEGGISSYWSWCTSIQSKTRLSYHVIFPNC